MPVDQCAQYRKQFCPPLHLIDHDGASSAQGRIQGHQGLAQVLKRLRVLQIKVNAVVMRGVQLCQCGLANLPGTKQGQRTRLGQPLCEHFKKQASINHDEILTP